MWFEGGIPIITTVLLVAGALENKIMNFGYHWKEGDLDSNSGNFWIAMVNIFHQIIFILNGFNSPN